MNCRFSTEGVFEETVTGQPLVKQTLTWNLISDSPDIEGEKREIAALKRAFLRWGQVIPVRFRFISNDKPADISITFSNTDSYFRNRPNALAYAFVGTTSQEIDIVFNESYNWVLNKEIGVNRYDVEVVAIHEIGHVLGLRHNAVQQDSVMYPNYQGIKDFNNSDMANIQAIHGERQGFLSRLSRLMGYFRRRL